MTRRAAPLLALLALAAVLGMPAGARADAVLDWNLHAQSTIFATGPTAHASTLSFAMVHGAVYDAVNAIDRRNRPYLRVPPAERWASKDAAAATAAFRVLAALYPAQLATLEGHYDVSLAAIADGRQRRAGSPPGEAGAAAMLAARENDGRLPAGTPYPFPQGAGPGEWRVSPPLTAVDPAWWVGNVKPFLIPAARWFLTDGPNALSSRAYARDLNEVKRIGALDSADRTADQTMAAIFWQAQPLAALQRRDAGPSARYRLGSADNARLFAMVTLAAADGAIVVLERQVLRRFWRPIDAIRLADTDGNPRTVADPGWAPVRSGDADDAGAGHAELPRPPVRPQLRDQRGRGRAAGLLRHGQDRVRRLEPALPRAAPTLRALLRRARGDRRSPRLGRHPLPHRRRPGRRDRRKVARWERRLYFQPRDRHVR